MMHELVAIVSWRGSDGGCEESACGLERGIVLGTATADSGPLLYIFLLILPKLFVSTSLVMHILEAPLDMTLHSIL